MEGDSRERRAGDRVPPLTSRAGSWVESPNRKLEDMGELASGDRELAEKVGRIFDLEIPAIGLDSEESFERLMRALTDRHARQRRRRLLLTCSLGAATVIIGLLAMLQLLRR